MSFRRLVVRSRRKLRSSRVLQVALLIVLWQAGGWLARGMGLPIPAGIVGMLVLLGLLAGGVVSVMVARRGARWLLAEMLLFFVPAVLGVLGHDELFGWIGLKVLAAIVLGIVIVMAVTAFAIEACVLLMGRSAAHE